MAYIVLFVVELVVLLRVILRPHRDPASRIAWIVVVLVVPILGIVAYLLIGETSIGKRRRRRMREIETSMPEYRQDDAVGATALPDRYVPLANVAQSISAMPPVDGNRGELMANSNATIDAMVADIDAATEHVHLNFYIWLTDNNGTKMIEALKRAAARGVVCRAMADGLGSRDLIASPQWSDMRAAGVKLAVALKIGNPLLQPLRGRIDLRNHRKILVIDNRITFCGSQNCADPEFRVKPDFAPWVDTVIRFEGPVARQNQRLFVVDWMENAGEDIRDCIRERVEGGAEGFPAVAFGTGPTVRFSAMPEMFQSMLYQARAKVVITTPYYVPDDSLQQALCAAAYRGIDTTIVFPARNDSWIVTAAASRS